MNVGVENTMPVIAFRKTPAWSVTAVSGSADAVSERKSCDPVMVNAALGAAAIRSALLREESSR
jgi:hypothetical protein